MNAQGILVAATILFAFMLLNSLWKRRESIVFTIRRTVKIELVYLGVVFLLVWAKQPPVVSILGGMVAGLVLGNRLPSQRSRYVRASAKRRAVARYELKTGKKFNFQKHEFDHIIPFSKGGKIISRCLRNESIGRSRQQPRGGMFFRADSGTVSE